MDRSKLISEFEPNKSNMLNILHKLQDNNPNNFLTKEDLKFVAEYLNTTYGSVYGVAKYYSMLSIKPRGKYIVKVCKSPVCHMISGNNIISEIENIIGVKLGETTNDRLFTLEPSECLGQCDRAPVMMINDKVHTELTTEKIKNIFQNIRDNQ